MNKEPDKCKPYMKAIKIPFKKLLKKNIDPLFVAKIDKAVIDTSIIVFHTYNFLNLLFAYFYERGIAFPPIDEHLILTIMMIVSKRADNRGGQMNEITKYLMDILMLFYNDHYRQLVQDIDIAYDDKLKQILQYQATGIVTNIRNNIAEHYVQHVNRLVNITFGVDDIITAINEDDTLTDDEKKTNKRAVWDEFRKVKTDLLSIDDPWLFKYTSDPKYHLWIFTKKLSIVPDKKEYDKNNIAYDVKSNTFDYLRCFFGLNREMQKINQKITEDNYFNATEKPVYKLFHVLPLRTSIVPKNIMIDTAALTALIFTKNKLYHLQNTKKEAYNIWSKIFNMNTRIFRKSGYQFNYMIHTDGVGCSLLFVKLDQNNKPCRRPLKSQLLEMDNDVPYIEETTITQQFHNKNIIAVDPGHDNLISCIQKNGEGVSKQKIKIKDAKGNDKTIVNRTFIAFRYTRSQRNVETKKYKYEDIRQALKAKIINNRSVIEIETELSAHNSKLFDYAKIREYLRKKIMTNRELREFYAQDIFRKLVMNSYINRQKSESKMIHNFRKKFGEPNISIVVFGDYDKKSTMHGSEPHKSRHLRQRLKIAGYEVYRINEFNTSKICNLCGSETKKYKKPGEKYPIWQLLRCTNVNCETIHNRDHNSPFNMTKITKNIIAGKGRPAQYTRG